MSVRCRRADAQDIDWLVGQLKEFSSFYRTRLPLFGDESQVRFGLGELISKHFVLIAEKTGPIGFIAGTIGPHTFNPKIRVLTELFWWVQKEFRLSRAGLMLLNEFVAFGHANADWIALSLIEGASPVKQSSLVKRGFHLHESSYLLEVQ